MSDLAAARAAADRRLRVADERREHATRAWRALQHATQEADNSARILAAYVLEGRSEKRIAIRAAKHRKALAAEAYAEAVWASYSEALAS